MNPIRPFARRLRRLSLLVILLAACRTKPASPTSTSTALVPSQVCCATSTAAASPTVPATAASTAAAYLDAWQRGDYPAMHALLAPESQAALASAAFEQAYRLNLSIMTAQAITPTVTALTEDGDSAEASVHLTYGTHLVGTVETDVKLPLKRAAGRWGVAYSPALIWPELVDGKQLYMVTIVPARGAIYDRNGLPMAAETDAYAVGLVPGEITDEAAVQSGLGRLLGVPAPLIKALYEFAVPDQYLAIGEVSAAELRRYNYLLELPGLRLSPYQSRFYFGNGAAAHVTGYTSFLQPEQVIEYQALGYAPDQRVGTTGLEGWAEAQLAGRNGGQLTLLDAAGNPLRAIAFGDSTPAQDVTTTIDFALQRQVQFALGDYTAAAVVLNRDTGEVLALASNPSFDPNLFDPKNLNLNFTSADTISRGVLNRATQDAYPAGSIFKIITFSAGLTSGLFQPGSEYTCNGLFEEVSGWVGRDWKEGGHGTITLKQGLSGSCNPWFWHIGKALYDWNTSWLSQTAVKFGLGQVTGLEAQQETPGRIPDPDWKLQNKGQAWEVIDNLNLAVGQGDVLVTPLQIAHMVAGVGNAGTLMVPQLVLRIQPPDGAPTYEFRPRVGGQLPLDETQLTALQEAMHNVTQEPLGTARNRFRGLRIPVAGKTGTAETGVPGLEDPHAWFAGYTFANRADRPDIAISVWVSNKGQGSDIAAPIFRRIVESYFGLPLVRYPWEESVGVPATPEPTATPEGTPAETGTPVP